MSISLTVKLKSVFCLVALACAMPAMAEEYTISQFHKSFVVDKQQIETLKIKVGDTINFRNEDRFFHNIYSLSDVKNFDLGSFRKGNFRAVTFDKPGIVPVECAIHPEMYMEIEVL